MWMIPTPWGPIMFHWCPQETMALMAMLPFIGGAWLWIRSKFKRHIKEEREAHHDCCHPHDEHKES